MTDFGSYAFGSFADNASELARLKQQAAAAAKLEIASLVSVGLAPSMRVLDLACGPAVVTAEIARAVSAGSVLGVDLNERLLEVGRAHLREQNITNAELRHANVYELDLPEASFDFVYSRFLFQHLNDPGRALANIHRVLKPGGIVCVVDVDDSFLALHPAPPIWTRIVSQAVQAQADAGGDRHIGRKLLGYCHEAGFTNSHVDVMTLSSQQLGLAAFLNITTGFKLQFLPADEQTAARASLKQLAEKNEATGFVSVFIASAKR